MTGKGTSHFGSIDHGRDGVIFHCHIICNNGCHGLLYDDDWTCKIVEMDSSAIPTA